MTVPLPAFTLDARPPTRPEITASVTRGAMRCLRARRFSVLTEVILATGRRVDILALSPAGRILVVEVKSGIEDWRADSKWSDYAPFCDALSFAVPADFPQALLPEDVGIIVADAYGGTVLREPIEEPLPPARRRAMMLRFATLAADRLHGLVDPLAGDASS
jgi:hypothetical protein